MVILPDESDYGDERTLESSDRFGDGMRIVWNALGSKPSRIQFAI